MQTKHPLEALNEHAERLILHYSKSHALSEAHRQRIIDKFAHKSLQELQEIVLQLDNPLDDPL